MLQSIINGIVPIAVTVIVGVLVAVIKAIGDAIVVLVEKRKEEVIQKIRINRYNGCLQVAREVWRVVDEYFRINSNIKSTISNKQKKFEEEILKILPDLTATQIEQLRQSVAGEINKDKDKIVQNDSEKI
ncbi:MULTISPECIES: hypothetical protein [Clostridium]|uniref:Uncharacterized protein n=3 Tax=Clostridium TaxID=1485 RepID=D8GJI3_CLOLD|nr:MULTISPECIES: hypothetical protein [Clostridium]ADK15144.1 conserved hypothetical protein [Clostridium ljungdahlii DSM 13528]AGY74402.1 cobalt ABC transporter permease [Clostridium autoethanogenum DSM 10061]ALU34589.1 Hypothetical protein CLAU_0160 [Clostridium autoethanogenum DSM 10061]OAA88621.1 hypothetical protein WX45_02555 [Clostridium ljungdahlii DSM 13528]OVY51309.1 hypothetical protein WX72_01441 [Clostridium autoethanogenum]